MVMPSWKQCAFGHDIISNSTECKQALFQVFQAV